MVTQNQNFPEQDMLFDATPRTGAEGGGYEYSYNVPEQQPQPLRETEAETSESSQLRRRTEVIAALGCLAQANKLHGYRRGVRGQDHERIARTTRGDVDGVTEGATFKGRQEFMRGKQAYLNAYNVGRTEKVDADDEEFNLAFAGFAQLYGVANSPEQTKIKSEQRTRLLKRLKAGDSIDAKDVPGLEQLSTPETNDPVETNTPEFKVANILDKLIGLRDGSLTGFMPATRSEGNQAFELQDYLDDGDNSEGVNKRLVEIFNRQQRVARSRGIKGRDIESFAHEPIRSKVNEWGDFLRDSIDSFAKLQKLKTQLSSGIGPHVSLLEAATQDDTDINYNQVVRYIQGLGVRNKNEEITSRNPLKTVHDRSNPTISKNKVVRSTFDEPAAVESGKQFEIDELARLITVKDARLVIDAAIESETKRHIFWEKVLHHVTEPGFTKYAEQALHDALNP